MKIGRRIALTMLLGAGLFHLWGQGQSSQIAGRRNGFEWRGYSGGANHSNEHRYRYH